LTFILLGVMFATRNIDWEIDNRILMLRLLWASVHAIAGGIVFLLYQRIEASKKTEEGKKVLTVKVAPSMMSPQPAADAEEKLTTAEYDARQLKELVTGIVMPAVIIVFLHYYYGAIAPLLSTSLLTLSRLYENKLVKIHLLKQSGNDLKRPFPAAENPFQKLTEAFSGAAGDAAAAGNNAAGTATNATANNGTPKRPASKKTD